tara:strand:+ start:392 stop:601 length:210 start_codon:yes stop_codon:yes gene_type:complete
MSDTLNKKEIKKLIELGKKIQLGLSCDINGQGIPCRTDRLQAVEDMIEYLKIHNLKIYQTDDNLQKIEI